MDDAPLRKWTAAATAPSGPIARLKLPLHALASEAMDVVGFCQRHWEPADADDGRPGHAGHPGLRSAVGGGTLPASIAEDLLELHASLHLADFRYRAAAGTGGGLLHQATDQLDGLRATPRWAFDDGKTDDADAQPANLEAEHGKALSYTAVAAALYDYAALAELYQERIAGLGGFDLRSIEQARTLASELRDRTGSRKVTREEQAAHDLRNRVGALLFERMQTARAAARFVFRKHPAILEELQSRYWRRVRASRD